jgi:hypothetical protein
MWDLWWTKWHWDRFFSELFSFPINIIPPWLSLLIYHLGDEQQACWWPQFRDIISPHQHEQQYQIISELALYYVIYSLTEQRQIMILIFFVCNIT